MQQDSSRKSRSETFSERFVQQRSKRFRSRLADCQDLFVTQGFLAQTGGEICQAGEAGYFEAEGARLDCFDDSGRAAYVPAV
jgi:hypothetical protein